VSKVQAYDFDIEYVKGKKNIVVDALSRRPATFSMTEISADWKSILLVEYSKNTFSCEMMEGIIQDDRYRVVDDIIYYKDRIYLVPESTLKDKILRAVHDTPLAGHPGYLKTYRQVRERFSWKGLKEDVLRYVRECMTCQQNKSELTHPAGLLQPLSIPEQKWESISMDFITGLSKVHGRDCIYVVVDRLTKYALIFHSFRVQHISGSRHILQGGVQTTWSSENIVSDRDNRFLSAFWQELFRLSGWS
jgi:hypothetical protein